MLLSKTDAAGRHVDYAYTPRGQLARRRWSRHQDPADPTSPYVATFYTYSALTGEQTNIDYKYLPVSSTAMVPTGLTNEGTPNLTYSYNRMGQTWTVADGTGSRTFAYDSDSTQLTAETLDATTFGGRVLSRSYDSTGTGTLGRSTGFALSGASGTGTDYSVTYGYDTYGRFNSLALPGGTTFSYAYTSNSNLISSISQGSWSQSMAYESDRDLLTSVENDYSSTIKAKFAYVYDDLGRRTSRVDTGEEFDRYNSSSLHTLFGYNDRSEVTSAGTYHGSTVSDTTSPVLGRDYGYAFDTIGNRTSSTTAGSTTSYTANNLNQYTQRAVPGTASTSGFAPTSATVSYTVNGGSTQSTTRQGSFFYSDYAASNTSGPVWLSFAVSSSLGGSSTKGFYLAKTPEAYSYDDDGNILTDGRFAYTWDAENRLTKIEPISAAIAVVPNDKRQKIEFAYDYLGRRVRKTVSNWSGSAYVAAVDRRYLYDGWNLIAEHDLLTSGSPAVNRYVWGLDLSGTMADGGGVRGLLAVLDVTSGMVHLPAYDGNGNVYALMNGATGALTACYEYSPFGETVRAVGSFASGNPFRFSTRYTDEETGYLYYGRRYYNPQLGRWMGRDPIEEKGGLHLYGFCGNNPINRYDVLGNQYDVTDSGGGLFRATIYATPDNGWTEVGEREFATWAEADEWGQSNSFVSDAGGFDDSGRGVNFSHDSVVSGERMVDIHNQNIAIDQANAQIMAQAGIDAVNASFYGADGGAAHLAAAVDQTIANTLAQTLNRLPTYSMAGLQNGMYGVASAGFDQLSANVSASIAMNVAAISGGVQVGDMKVIGFTEIGTTGAGVATRRPDFKDPGKLSGDWEYDLAYAYTWLNKNMPDVAKNVPLDNIDLRTIFWDDDLGRTKPGKWMQIDWSKMGSRERLVGVLAHEMQHYFHDDDWNNNKDNHDQVTLIGIDAEIKFGRWVNSQKDKIPEKDKLDEK